MYIDLYSDRYEDEYETLLRTLYEQPESRKTAPGNPPEFLFKEATQSLLPIKRAHQEIRNS